MTVPEDRRISGACLCGAVRFEVQLPTLFCAHCHCTMCQRNHGAGYVTWFGVKPEQMKLLQGDDRLVGHRSSEHGTRSFCGACGSSIFCENAEHPDRLDIVLASVEGEIDQAPQAHVFYSDRASWIQVGDALPKLGGKTGMEPLPPEDA
jgi:hypothetical protein